MAAGQYGSYKYESQEARALGSITVESYDKDQAKNLIKLNNDVTYMAAYMRKMQKGIDEANQNFIQQIQAFIADVIVLLGGGNAQGFDFGDLKYVLQMIGALLGFDVDGGIAGLLPLNAFDALWHMLSTYIFPSAQFADVINSLIDTAIAQILDIFGEIPVVGEALQQLAVIITEIRDGIGGLLDLINTILDALNLENADLAKIGDWFGGLFSFLNFIDFSAPNFDPVQAVVQWLTDMAGELLGGANWGELLQLLTGNNGGSNPLGALADLLSGGLFGNISVDRIPQVGLGALSQTNPNLLQNGSFTGSISVGAGPDWSHDATDGYSTPLGCAKTTANGATHVLRSNIIPVAEDEKLAISARAKWSGFAAPGGSNPIRVNVTFYWGNEMTLISQALVGGIATPGASGGWQLISNTITVPANSDRCVVELTVTNAATAGTVKFDDSSLAKTQLLQSGWVSGLAELMQMFADVFNALTFGLPTTVGSILSRFANINTAGQINANALTNMNNIPTIPNLIGKAPDFQALIDKAHNALSGASLVGQELVDVGIDTAKNTMEKLFETLADNVRKVQDLEADATSNLVGGKSFKITFSDYPDGDLPTDKFTVYHFGPGTSKVGITDGKLVWRTLVNNGARSAIGMYNEPTLTDFQVVRGTMSSPPEQAANVRVWAIGRGNSALNPTDYVFARGYCTGFLTYKGDIGCVKNGVEYVWASGISLTWSLDMRLISGVGNNPRRHMVLSGNQIVWDGVETPGMLSNIDANHRYWGARSDTNGVQTSGAIAGASTVDNAPPAVIGTTFRASRRVGQDTTIGTGGVKMPNNFYETVDYISPDLVYTPGTNCRLTVSKQGTYLVQYRVLHGAYASGSFGHGLLYKNGIPYERGSWAGNQLNLGFSVNTTLEDATYASFVVPLQPGDYIEPGEYFTSSMSNTGDAATMADGTQSWFAVTRVGIA